MIDPLAPRRAALVDHLKHGPAVPEQFLEAAEEAIAAVNAADTECRIAVPGGREVSAESIVEGLDLHGFIESEEA